MAVGFSLRTVLSLESRSIEVRAQLRVSLATFVKAVQLSDECQSGSTGAKGGQLIEMVGWVLGVVGLGSVPRVAP